ncbi:MAG: helix-turn-helix transcriptional regulator [Candidatus Omnitrophica bacterium]|nr:helix-turn-helix transcriptional regulator [Candidatus Omnitrophota bacterium]MCB9770661.1 helix-turn-helix transcriptional regulator [Candidatus Omnitrophota bacterium]
MDRQLLKGHLPVIILGLLAEEPRHGYAIAEELKRRCSSAFELGEGTLYPLLYRLEDKGQIKSKWVRLTNGKERRVYQITPAGKRTIAAHQKDWNRLAEAFRNILGEEWAKA